jgi:AraC-like DNA-binding protein
MRTQSHVRIIRQASSAGTWELAFGCPAAALRPHVLDYCGYLETAPGVLRRRELPGPQVVVIFDFGPGLRLLDRHDMRRSVCHPNGFVAGLTASPTHTEHNGLSRGIQVNFTPIGARLFFGVPMSELTDKTVALDDVLPATDRQLSLQLQEAIDWDARFELLDRFILARVNKTSARLGSQRVAWAVAQIEHSGGLLEISGLAPELGISAKHLIHQFHDQVGMAPKMLARLVRFNRVMQHLKTSTPADLSWTQIALEFGYYDQAHLIREFNQFAGETPSAVRAGQDQVAMTIAAEQSSASQDPARG